MDEKFLELLGKLDADIASLTDAELTEARDGITEYGKQLRDQAPDRSEADKFSEFVADVERLGEALKTIDAELETRTTAAAESAAKLDEAFAAFGPDEAPEGETTETEAAVTETETEEAEPVKAKVASVADIARRRKPPEPARTKPLVAAAVGGPTSTQMGSPYGDPVELAQAMWDAHGRGPNGSQTVARIRIDNPIVLTDDAELNYAAINRVKSGVAAARIAGTPLTAAGFCATPEPVYEFLQAGSRDGIVDLPQMTARRGRFTFPELYNIRDLQVQNGVAWETTGTMDEDAVEKPCYTIVCGDGITAQVQAYSTCLRFSNFDSQFWPERVTHVEGQAMIAADHEVNLALLTDIAADPRTETAIDGFTNGGTWVQFVQSVSLHGAYIRNRYRLPIASVLEAVVPAYVLDALVADQVARNATIEYGMAIAQIEDALARARINVQWVYDWQELADANWPADFNYLLFPAGHVVRLNGGTINLGVVRDSTLNVANDFQVFSETFDGHAIVGPGVLYVTGVDLCPNGEAAADAALSCADGS